MAEKNTSRVEIYSFRSTGLIQDQFVLKSAVQTAERFTDIRPGTPNTEESPLEAGRPSITELLNNTTDAQRKDSYFSSMEDSKDSLAQQQIRVEKPNGQVRSSASTNSSAKRPSNGAESVKATLPLDKLLAQENYSFKVKALTYCDQLDLLSVGLSNGMVVNYTF